MNCRPVVKVSSRPKGMSIHVDAGPVFSDLFPALLLSVTDDLAENAECLVVRVVPSWARILFVARIV